MIKIPSKTNTQKLGDELYSIYFIYFRCRHSFEIFKYLNNQIIASEEFWGFLKYLSLKDTVVELDKLLSDRVSHKYNLVTFLKRFQTNGIYAGFGINKNKITEFQTLFSKHSDFIEEIKTLRDKHFAHTDPVEIKDKSPLSIDYSDIIDIDNFESVFNLIKEIIVEISSHCLNIYRITDLFFHASDLRIFEKFEEYDKLKVENTINKLNMKKKVK